MLKKVFWRRPEGRAAGSVISDKELASVLRKKISGELPDAGLEHLTFYVRGGIVTMQGSVKKLDDRIFVKQLVTRTPGVVKVFDHLAVDA